MGSYHVDTAPEHGVPHLYLLVGALLVAALMAVAAPSFTRLDITVDGVSAALPPGAHVSDLTSKGLTAPPGNVLSSDGAVVMARGGGEPVVLRGGHPLDATDMLVDGDRLTTLRGPDVVESEVETVVPIPIEVSYEGKGPLMALASPGAVGVRRVVAGELSGREVTSTVETPMQPMLVRRYAPDGAGKLIALTFDDGPWPGSTAAVLDALKAEDVKATFFMIGRQVYRYPDVVKRVKAEGHTIGNHTEDHVYMTGGTPPATVRFQIAEGQTAVQKVAQTKPRWFRPPGGYLSPAVGTECGRYGLRVAMWTADTQDWRKPAVSTLVQRIVSSAKPGAVILLHDGGGDRTRTVEALGPAIRELKKRGYTFVTLDELADR